MGWTKIDMQLQRVCHPATAKYATFLPVRVHAFPSPECGFMHVMVLNGIDLWYRLNMIKHWKGKRRKKTGSTPASRRSQCELCARARDGQG